MDHSTLGHKPSVLPPVHFTVIDDEIGANTLFDDFAGDIA
jgi:hypothetical protein